MNKIMTKKSINLAKKVICWQLVIFVLFGFLAPINEVNALEPLVISNVIVTNLTNSSATITWQSNRAAYGRVDYGTAANSLQWYLVTSQKLSQQSITVFGLSASTDYYFRLMANDDISNGISSIMSFKTAAGTNAGNTNYNYNAGAGACLADPSMGIDITKHVGYFGLYYSLPDNHPDVELPAGSAWTKVGRQNDWYNANYLSFSRIDKQLNFGDNFFPIPGKSNHFAVNWRAVMLVPENGNYTYSLTSDDDSWLLIDDQLVSNLGGLHPAKTENRTVQLTAGYHKLEIFYADRRHYGATFRFIPDSRLKFNPMPDGCSIQNIIDYSHLQNSGYTGNTGQVAGAEYDPNSVYLNGPNPKYTLMKALYKTNDSPDVWAILATNQRLYITSPASFNEYGLNWNKIKTVSRKTLESYPVASLVKLPDNPEVYYLHQRAEKRWLKLLIPTGTVFVSYPGNYWGNVARINSLDYAQYPTATLIKVSGKSTIYNISGNTKRPYSSDAAFRGAGNNWADISPVSQIHADSYLDGPAI